jgi:hypothetical protein
MLLDMGAMITIYPIDAPFEAEGYHFARFGGNSLYITWARITKRRSSEEMIAILNQGKTTYVKIDFNAINFSVEGCMRDHGG